VSRYRRPAAVAGFAISLAGVAVLAAGCSLAAPTPTVTPYPASDGTNAQLVSAGGATVSFRNFLLVSAAKGKPGVLVGAVTTDSADPVEIRLQVLDASGQNPLGQTSFTAKPAALAQVGPGGTVSLQISNVPSGPGTVLRVRAATPAGGTDFNLPVLAPTNAYASITASSSSS
jgi:hypothetical protein